MHTRHAIAAAVCLLAGQASWAQSGVTLGGVADAAARLVRNESLPSVKSLVSGSNSTSRILFRGTEDLGDGLSAGFHLEHGIALDTGSAVQATQFWDRRSTVSLASKAAGELRLGRDFVPSYVGWSRFDPFAYVGVAGSNNTVSATPLGPIRNAFGTNPNTTVRSSNAIQWLTPGGWGGIEGGIMVAAREGGTAASGQARLIGTRLGYAAGWGNVSAAHTTSRNDLTASGGAFKDTVLAGQANVGAGRITLAWRRFSQGSAEQTNTMLAGAYPIGAFELKASVIRVDLEGRVGTTVIDANGARQFGLGGVYNLSRRSALYATASRIDNDGVATYAVPGGAAGLAGGRTSTGFELGVRHNF